MKHNGTPQPRALVGNMADEEQVKEADEKELSGFDLERANWRATIDTYEGRHVLWMIMEHCNVFSSVIPVSTPIDPLALARNAGKQDVGHFVMLQVEESDPEALAVMRREHHLRIEANA